MNDKQRCHLIEEKGYHKVKLFPVRRVYLQHYPSRKTVYRYKRPYCPSKRHEEVAGDNAEQRDGAWCFERVTCTSDSGWLTGSGSGSRSGCRASSSAGALFENKSQQRSLSCLLIRLTASDEVKDAAAALKLAIDAFAAEEMLDSTEAKEELALWARISVLSAHSPLYSIMLTQRGSWR